MSGYIVAFPVSNLNAKTVGNGLLSNVYLVYGPPVEVLTDNGSPFQSTLMAALHLVTSSTHTFSPAYSPQSNGQVEIFMKTLGNMLAGFVAESHKQWDTVLAALIYAYNTSKLSATGYTPFEIVFGHKPHSNFRLMEEGSMESMDKQTRAFIEKLHTNWTLAIENRKKFISESVSWANKKRKICPFKVGDMVYIRSDVKAGRNECQKFVSKWLGPMEILEFRSANTVSLRQQNGKKLGNIHVDRLKRAHLL